MMVKKSIIRNLFLKVGLTESQIEESFQGRPTERKGPSRDEKYSTRFGPFIVTMSANGWAKLINGLKHFYNLGLDITFEPEEDDD